MWVYKITNIKNNKVYIGQTIRPIKERFKRHLNDAINNKLNTHFARAIRKYGADNFIIEKIDEAINQEELTKKETYWIRYYNSTVVGYNETDSETKCGGNTYKNKTEAEMKIIEEKISLSKIGGKNPQARKVKKIDNIDNTFEIFDSVIECARSFGLIGKTSITVRLNGKIKTLFRKRYSFEYINE